MQSFNHDVIIESHAITIQDAIILLPLMDDLAERHHHEVCDLSKRIQDHREKIEQGKKSWFTETDYYEQLKRISAIENQIELLGKLGFVMSDPSKVQKVTLDNPCFKCEF